VPRPLLALEYLQLVYHRMKSQDAFLESILSNAVQLNSFRLLIRSCGSQFLPFIDQRQHVFSRLAG
jgi:hypothetical protein